MNSFRRLVAALPLIALVLVRGASAQQNNGSLAGYVTCNDGNVPARHAHVELVPLNSLLGQGKGTQEGAKAATDTDFTGHYELTTVVPGTYIIHVAQEGYADDYELIHAYLDRFSAGDRQQLLASLPSVLIKAGSASRKDFVLRRAASIAGRVRVDLGGTPGKVAVFATLVATPGALASPAAAAGLSRSAVLDDRGDYRIAGLPSGTYRLSVRITESFFSSHVTAGKTGDVTLEGTRPGTAELTVFAPDALQQAAARLVRVSDSDEITGIDITVPARLLHSLGGVVTEGGMPRPGVSISLQLPDGSAQLYGALSDSNGSYRFDLLPAGVYTVVAHLAAQGTAGAPRASTARVSVHLLDNDISDANVELSAAPAH